MTGMLLGMAMLVSTAGVSPAEAPVRATFTPPAFTFTLPDEATMAAWARETAPRVRTRTPKAPKPPNMTDRIIGVAAGATIGFFTGAYIGARITDRSKENPDDDTSALKGALIGGPLGTVVGAILGWHLTK